jgi:hypothetical protein
MTRHNAPSVVIPNQVFIGLPWKNVRATYERVIDRLHLTYPISFVIVGREDGQDAEDLLEVIKDRVQSSTFAIFDATDGNANVSLEYGYAEALDIKRALYVSARKRFAGRADSPIISDLAGKRRNQYKTKKTLRLLLNRFCHDHAYTRRFERFISTLFPRAARGRRKRLRSLALKVIHFLDGKREVRREDVVNDLQGDVSRYRRDEIDQMILSLHRAGLIVSVQGPYSTISIR